MLHHLRPTLQAGDIVIYDRAAGHYVGAAQMRAAGADLISRVAIRKIDWRRGQRLSRHERLVVWDKSHKQPAYLTDAQWAQMPEQITVRIVREPVTQPGFRVRELTLVTTLLDATLYPAAAIAQAFLRRWRLEMGLDDLKTTLHLEHLRCQSPAMIARELRALLIAHNLVRCVMAQAAREHAVPVERISFKGTLDAVRHFSAALAQSASAKRRRALWAELLRTLATDLVPLRPGRREPRAVKRRPKAYRLLNRPRHLYRESPRRRYKSKSSS